MRKMDYQKEKRIKDVRNQIRRILIFWSPGPVILAFGLYGMFGANGHAFYPLLNKQSVVLGLLIVGLYMVIVQVLKLFPLLTELGRLLQEEEGKL